MRCSSFNWISYYLKKKIVSKQSAKFYTRFKMDSNIFGNQMLYIGVKDKLIKVEPKKCVE